MVLTKKQIKERIDEGKYLVPNFLHDDAARGYALKIGDPYVFNYLKYKVIEICEADLDGYCWIERLK